MLVFLGRLWQLVKPYRVRLVLGVLAGIASGLVSPLLIGTIMFVFGTVFPTANTSSTYNMTNNAVAWPAITLAGGSSTNFTVSVRGATNNFSGGLKVKTSATPAAGVFVFLSGAINSNAKNNSIYTIVVTNSGPLAVSNVMVSANFPTNFNFNTASPTRIPVLGKFSIMQRWFNSARAALAANDLRSHPWALGALIAAIPFIMLLRGIFGYLDVYCLQWVTTRAVTDLRTRLFSHLLDLSAGFYTENSSGQLMSNVMNDTGALQGILASATRVIVSDPVTLVSVLGMMLWKQPMLTIIVMSVLPLAVIPIVIYGRKVRQSSRATQLQSGDLTQIMIESFTGHRVIKAYGLESVVAGQFHSTARKSIGDYMRMVRAAEIPGPLIEFFGSCGVALVLVYLILQAKSHPGTQPSSTDFIQLIGSVFIIYAPMKNLTRLQNQVIQARASSERVFALLATKNAVPEPASPRPLKSGEEIYFDNVSFAYGKKTVLNDINLHIKPGQLVALVGASGAGKTTLSNLLLRFYDPQYGAVRIGGVDIREASTADLRKQIAVVAQETILFNETIRRNIELGRPGATDEEIIAAAKHAHAHQFIMEKPGGYNTVIGEKGVLLSGGQRQRIAIARAVLKNAPILILDEATNALDTESERAVQSALDQLMKGRTTLCIAHRFSTILHADLIVVMEQGRIIETGRHDDLMNRGGVYQKLYEMQFKS
jgi:subfamily B ATP-binding cassette protein MsbA